MEKKAESNFITEMQYNSNKYLGGSKTRGQTRGPNVVIIMYIFFEKSSPRNFAYTDSFGMLEFWNVFLCSYHNNFKLQRTKS